MTDTTRTKEQRARMDPKLNASVDPRAAFEKFWKRRNTGLPDDPWMKRSSIWGEAGYLQPCVHGDWLAFKAGVDWARKQK